MGQALGIKFDWVPYEGSPLAIAAAMGRHIDAVAMSASVLDSFVKSGQMRVLAVSSAKPMPTLPGTPTFASLGYKQLTSENWRGVMIKAGTPPAVTAKLGAILKAVAPADMRNGLNRTGY